MIGTVFNAVLYTGFFASALIILVVLIRAVTNKRCNRILCFLWIMIAVRLLCPFSVKHTIEAPDFLSVYSESSEHTAAQDIQHNKNYKKPDGFVEIEETELKSSEAGAVKEKILMLAPIVWIIGVGVVLTLQIISFLLLKHRLSCYIQEDGAFICDSISVPFVLGVICPKIYIPSGSDEKARRDVIAHEKMHIRHGDHILRALYAFTASLYWFHPLVWLAFGLFCRDVELSCDDAVVSKFDSDGRQRYINSMLSFAKINGQSGSMYLNGFSRGIIKERVKNISAKKKLGFTAKVLILLVGGLALAVSFMIGIKHIVKEQKSNDENQPKSTLGAQKEEYYYSLSADNGLTVFVWENAKNDYRCGLMEGIDRTAIKPESILDMVSRQGISVDEMKEVLLYYNLPENMIAVEPCSNPVSSFSSVIEMPYEEYKAFLRGFFFPMNQ